MSMSLEFEWTVLYVGVLTVSCALTAATLLLSFKHINLVESAVQRLTHTLCQSYFLFALSRWVFYIAVLCNWSGVRTMLDNVQDGELLGIRVVYAQGADYKLAFVALSLVGDIAVVCTTCWVCALAYEMKRLICKDMDRGARREREVMRQYKIRTYAAAVLFTSAMLGSALMSPDHERLVRTIAMVFQLVCVWISLIYLVWCSMAISFRKRVKTAINPSSQLLHQRIKKLVVIYLVLVLPSCICELLDYAWHVPSGYMGLSQALFYFSGAGTAYVVGFSASCCFQTLQPIMPTSVYDQLMENGFFPSDPGARLTRYDVEPPCARPIFVCTDIEGSTSLWARDAQAMAEAQSLHDDLIRRELVRFRGYEITTVGDAFQLAFHNVSDAIAWCIRVQEKLLKVHWPSNLLKFDKCQRVYDLRRHLLFNGIRVRMAIHDGDEQLICSIHPTTGKLTYLGMSEMVAREISDVGRGGEVLISESSLRIYERERDELMQHKVHGTFHCELVETPFDRPDLDLSFSLHRIIPSSLGDRFKREEEMRELKRLVRIRPQHVV